MALITEVTDGAALVLVEGQTRIIRPADDFPWWRYDGIRDGRQGKDHEQHFGKYYLSSTPFQEVRGDRMFNCRCCPTPVWRRDVERLKAQGFQAEG